jgi:hypothetical protein
MPVTIKIQDWVWIHVEGQPVALPNSFHVDYQDDGVVDNLLAYLDTEKIGVLSGRHMAMKGSFHGAFSREDAVKVVHWLEKEGLLPVPNYHEGYKWIKVPRYKDDASLSWEERYKALDAHHIKETSFLIAKIRELTAPQ